MYTILLFYCDIKLASCDVVLHSKLGNFHRSVAKQCKEVSIL